MIDNDLPITDCSAGFGSVAKYVATSLREVALTKRSCCPDFISDDGFGITDAARRYLAPLIVGEAYSPFKNGRPDYVKLPNVAAPRELTTEFAV